jgi:hypothetical protein
MNQREYSRSQIVLINIYLHSYNILYQLVIVDDSQKNTKEWLQTRFCVMNSPLPINLSYAPKCKFQPSVSQPNLTQIFRDNLDLEEEVKYCPEVQLAIEFAMYLWLLEIDIAKFPRLRQIADQFFRKIC